MKRIINFLILLMAITYQTNVLAEMPYFIDFKYILNQSEAGKKAQLTLKNKLEGGIKSWSPPSPTNNSQRRRSKEETTQNNKNTATARR